ncbi:MAG: hypothetical protein IJF45_06945, partial [Clostridia bacterium]|nr:hypothetical protein [Clostridia bacterium]
MKKKMLQRLLALVLAVTFIFGGTLTIGAAGENAGGSGSTTDKTLADIREQLNADAYETYIKNSDDVERATTAIEIDGTQYKEFIKGSATGPDVREIVLDDGTKLLYTPNAGTTKWEVNIPATAKYSIIINYLPDDAKTASIERILKIDDTIPFAEA